VIGGITPRCLEAGRALYEQAIEQIVAVSGTEAPNSKLLENTFRSVNIALVNEMAQVADRLGVDVFEVIEAAATKPFGFMKFTPGPGIGGHCIPLDPHYLAWKMKTLNYKTRMIELAGEINSEMPNYVVDKVQDALNERGKPVRGSRILILGMAYKRDIDDVRESPSLDVMRLLLRKGADVIFHDPYVSEVRDENEAYECAADRPSAEQLRLRCHRDGSSGDRLRSCRKQGSADRGHAKRHPESDGRQRRWSQRHGAAGR
jgi:UDP-N-acetyl-D-glucosamine dehydrogenase